MSASQPRTLRITRRDKWGHRVEIDGYDVSSALLGMTLEIKAGEMPRATLHVVAEEIPTDTDEVLAYLPDATHELLVRLGWTPPAEEATP
ncbi:hypothetical protein SGFS_065740 [Streptomyces graminofaciens]|uniref:Uncharacterized protein n=1 Tax=Streptomyces graminofaciens TaxID=68212 RepID=A0ABM7FDZ7_9ACTN|nr:hypothetical protein [Streptomyces graminofaciens]BBC35280.1 hypothetical protein SGFS_065740 [Streptomyces graminofaciens]